MCFGGSEYKHLKENNADNISYIVNNPIEKSLELVYVIGKGEYGTVKYMNDKKGNSYAVKTIVSDLQCQNKNYINGKNEIVILNRCNHPNIIQYHYSELYYIGKTLITTSIVTDLYFSNLKEYMRNIRQCINPLLIKLYMYQLLSGIAYLHENNIIHADIKPENLLVNDTGKLVIADFGLSFKKNTEINIERVTVGYKAPELLLGQTNYNESTDMWSVGCVFAELAHPSLQRVFFSNEEYDIKLPIYDKVCKKYYKTNLLLIIKQLGLPKNNNYKWWDNSFPNCVPEGILTQLDIYGQDLLLRLLSYNDRISAKEALNHEYFSDKSFVKALPN